MRSRQVKELDKLLVFLGGVKRLVDGMYTVGLYMIVEVVVRGLHIRKKGPRDFAAVTLLHASVAKSDLMRQFDSESFLL
jgi:hypothetical protein